MNKYIIWTSLVIVVFICSLAGLYWLLQSVWLPWGMLPNYQNKLALNLNEMDPDVSELLLSSSDIDVPYEKFPLIKGSVALGWNSEGSTFVLRPAITQRSEVVRYFSSQDVKTRFLGPWLIAGDGILEIPTVKELILTSGKNIFLSRWPVFPSLLISLSSEKAWLDSNKFILGEKEDSGFSLILADSESSDMADFVYVKRIFDPSFNTDAFVKFKGSVLGGLPENLKSAWNASLAKKFTFAKNKPDFISYLSQFDEVIINFNEEASTIGVKGANSIFSDAVNTWVQKEQSYKNPQRQAFKLPDGSIGYEQVPGELKPAFLSKQAGCMKSLPGQTQLWLCEIDDYSFLSTSDNISKLQDTVEEKDAQWSVSLKSDYASLIDRELLCNREENNKYSTLCNIKRINGIGNSSEGILRIIY